MTLTLGAPTLSHQNEVLLTFFKTYDPSIPPAFHHLRHLAKRHHTPRNKMGQKIWPVEMIMQPITTTYPQNYPPKQCSLWAQSPIHAYHKQNMQSLAV
jgi:hypothetical protein